MRTTIYLTGCLSSPSSKADTLHRADLMTTALSRVLTAFSHSLDLAYLNHSSSTRESQEIPLKDLPSSKLLRLQVPLPGNTAVTSHSTSFLARGGL